MPGKYEDWQELLSAAFFLPHEGPTVLFLDENELSRLRPEVEDAPQDLADAVRPHLLLDDDQPIFGLVADSYRHWERGARSGPPPVLPVIAITVLAATRMRSDYTARSTNYYLRLAQALQPDGSDAAIERLRHRLREGGAFLDAVDFWRGLHDWIEEQGGAVGTSTIRGHQHLLRIGYPLSQALVRQSDQATLTRFFLALDFHPGPPPPATVLVSALDIWTSKTHNGLSEPLMHALGDSDTRQLVGSVIEGHAHAWDGVLLTGDGKRSITLRLGLDVDQWQARWLFALPASGPTVVTLFAPEAQGQIELTTPTSGAYYSVHGSLDVTAELVSSGLRMSGSEFGAEFPPSPAVFLRPDSQTGAWSSVSGLIPFEEHLVAIESKYVAEFGQVLQEAAVGGWRNIPQRGSVLLRGYALFERVRFSDAAALEAVLSRLPALRRIGVAPVMVPRARLVRGLPIATDLSSGHYLTGGEPDLLLPTGPDPRMTTVTLDGVREEIQANGFPLELRRFPDGARKHTIEADGQELSFTTLDEGPDPVPPSGTATLGWNRDGQMCGLDQPTVIMGAFVDGPVDDAPLLARRGKDESWLLHDDGGTESVAEPARPHFLDGIDIEIPLSRFEIDAPKSARWLAQRRGTRWHLTEIGCEAPRDLDADFDVTNSWRSSSGNRNGAKLWEWQLRIAGTNP